MASCKKCLYLSRNGMNIYGEYFCKKNRKYMWEGAVLATRKCKEFIPRLGDEDYFCSICGELAGYVQFLSCSAEFRCQSHLVKATQHPFYGWIEISEFELDELNQFIESWCLKAGDRFDNSRLIPNLPSKELQTYKYIKDCAGGAVLISSLPRKFIGPLGNLNNRGLIDFYVIQKTYLSKNGLEMTKSFKAVKLANKAPSKNRTSSSVLL